jgi:hypothetical protein
VSVVFRAATVMATVLEVQLLGRNGRMRSKLIARSPVNVLMFQPTSS